MTTRLEKLRQQYFELAHALQSGVAFKIDFDAKDTEPKHLRVGLNMVMCSHTALVKLLISKGLITETEYFHYVVKELRDEINRYRREIADHHDVSVDKIQLL